MSDQFVEFSDGGGPAFPLDFEYMDQFGTMRKVYSGMTLRDYLAAKAMAALISLGDTNHNIRIAPLVESAYDLADAMLARRDA